MISKKISGEGTFPSICWDPVDNCVHAAWQVGRTVGVADLDPQTLSVVHVQSWDVLGAEAAYPELGFADGRCFVAWRDGAPPNHGHLKDLLTGATQDLGPIHGARPSCFGGGFFAWIVDGSAASWPTVAARLVRDRPVTGTLTRNAAGTGLSHVDATPTWCTITTIDEARGAFPGMGDPSWVSTCVVGTTDIDGQPCLRSRLFSNSFECLVAKGEVSKDPRICTDGVHWYIIAWSDSGEGVRVWKLGESDFTSVNIAYPRSPNDLSTPTTPKYLGHYHTNSKYGEYYPQQNCPVLGVFLYTDGEGHTPPDADGKVAAALEDNDRCVLQADERSINAVRSQWSKVAALIIGEMDNADQVKQAVADAHKMLDRLGMPQRPVVSTLTVNQTTDGKYNGAADIAGVELYFDKPSATYDAMEQAVAQRVNAVMQVHKGKVLFIVQSYDRSNPAWTDGMLEAIQWACHEAMCKYGDRVIGCLWFSYARPTGVLTHPSLEPWHDGAVFLTTTPDVIDDPSPEPPPQENDMTHDEIRAAIRSLDDPLVFGALQRFHNEVLPRDRPVDPVKNAEGGDFNTADVVTGGAFTYFVRSYVSEAIIAIDKKRTPAQASGDGYDEAIKAYMKVADPQ